jgi:hypothetical protein
VGDREAGCLEEGACDFDRVSEVARHPEAEACERELDERRRGECLGYVGYATRCEDIEPGIAAEQ